MTDKRFTNIEHDYENAWIKCNDDGDFMIYAIYKELDDSLPSLEDLLNGLNEENEELKKENEQLKQRNDRQAKRLSNLYHLIEKEDWKTLKGLIQEFQECEEQLQKEWGTYGDVE